MARESRRRVDVLLNQHDLTEVDLLSYIQGIDDDDDHHRVHMDQEMREHEGYRSQLVAYRSRRKELNRLRKLLPRGRALIDSDGRLVPLDETQQGAQNMDHNPLLENGDQVDDHLLMNPLVGDANEEHDHNIHEQFLRQQQDEAAQAIQRVLQNRYKGVPRHKLQLVTIRPDLALQQRGRLTLRRICCAVFAVATAFVAIMVRSLPSEFDDHHRKTSFIMIDPTKSQFTSSSASAATIVFSLDVLLQALAKARLPHDHLRECESLENRRTRSSWSFPWMRDCSDGVLFIPSLSLSTVHSTDNLIWRRQCAWSEPAPSCFASATESTDGTCPSRDANAVDLCFRGVHDNLVNKEQVAAVISLGKSIIRGNPHADHFDIHRETERLPSSIIYMLHELLTTTYHMPQSIEPVAFRVFTAAPRNGDTSFYTQSGTMMQHPLLRLMNRKRFLQWTKAANMPTKPWPWSLLIHAPSNRFLGDACHVLADQQADAQFQVYSSIFLTEDYSDGAALFVDETHALDNVRGRRVSPWMRLWRRRRNRRIQRGLAVDGRLGRVVVSSGDNLRCHLPVRQGIRAVLQIWWGCESSDGR